MMSKDFKRACPTCGKAICYETPELLEEAIKRNGNCKSCAAYACHPEIQEERTTNFDKELGKWFRYCPDCGDKCFYTSQNNYGKANLHNTKCRSCSNYERNKPLYEQYADHYDSIQDQWFNICTRCNGKIIYSGFVPMKNAIKPNICRSCIATSITNTPEFKAQAREKTYKANGLVSKAKLQRRSRKIALNLDPDIPFLKRKCPRCGQSISYSAEKSALQAEEHKRICKACVNLMVNERPGYTEKRMENAMKAAHSTRANASKLEISLIPLMNIFGFEHSSNNGNKRISDYRPDFINDTEKLVIEIYGDYWHCNPNKYNDPTRYMPQLKKTVGEVWQRDQNRVKLIEAAGYTVIIIWEQDIDKRLIT
jgi:G:T-mismatch repair DNA endonuclease (very short patch repair protein)/endogenous inhibitor of DNA gyrase (YacG/DUF329 family)